MSTLICYRFFMKFYYPSYFSYLFCYNQYSSSNYINSLRMFPQVICEVRRKHIQFFLEGMIFSKSVIIHFYYFIDSLEICFYSICKDKDFVLENSRVRIPNLDPILGPRGWECRTIRNVRDILSRPGVWVERRNCTFHPFHHRPRATDRQGKGWKVFSKFVSSFCFTLVRTLGRGYDRKRFLKLAPVSKGRTYIDWHWSSFVIVFLFFKEKM